MKLICNFILLLCATQSVLVSLPAFAEEEQDLLVKYQQYEQKTAMPPLESDFTFYTRHLNYNNGYGHFYYSTPYRNIFYDPYFLHQDIEDRKRYLETQKKNTLVDTNEYHIFDK